MEVDTENTEAVDKGESVSELIEISNSESTKEETQEDITSSGRIAPAPGVSIQFKKPLLIGPRKGVNKFNKIRPVIPTNDNSIAAPIVSEENVLAEEPPVKVDKSPAEKIIENSTPIPYKEPKWSGLPSSPYSFEVLKSGTIVETITLNDKPFHVFGKLSNCDIVMAHPTVSRYHAVIQYRSKEENDLKAGYYLYDLGSTHGTFLNKHKLKSNVYYRVQVGHMIKLGMSSRNFILQGPSEDEEPESEFTITELKELRLKKQLEAEAAEKEKIMMAELEEEKRRQKEERDGIDWGMGEDADEETDLSENPFAATQNEELYISDPKKTLRGWFEREGYELEYMCEEKGFSQFVCRVELPIDNARGLPIIAEAVVKGKKKEAVVQCALEACRLLDQHGLLRQSNHESKKRKAKNWEENDYYDSDEDTFLDRTGTVEKKRNLRMEQAGLKTNHEVHTYQTLVEKHEKIIQEIQAIEKQIQESLQAKEDIEMREDNEDELDAYMSSLSEEEKKSKTSVHKLKAQLASLKQQEISVRNLANIAKPAQLPPLKGTTSQPSSDSKASKKLPIFGKRKITKNPQKVFQKFVEAKKEEEGNDEEVDSD